MEPAVPEEAGPTAVGDRKRRGLWSGHGAQGIVGKEAEDCTAGAGEAEGAEPGQERAVTGRGDKAQRRAVTPFLKKIFIRGLLGAQLQPCLRSVHWGRLPGTQVSHLLRNHNPDSRRHKSVFSFRT